MNVKTQPREMEVVVKLALIYLVATAVTVKMVITCFQINLTVKVRRKPSVAYKDFTLPPKSPLNIFCNRNKRPSWSQNHVDGFHLSTPYLKM